MCIWSSQVSLVAPWSILPSVVYRSGRRCLLIEEKYAAEDAGSSIWERMQFLHEFQKEGKTVQICVCIACLILSLVRSAQACMLQMRPIAAPVHRSRSTAIQIQGGYHWRVTDGRRVEALPAEKRCDRYWDSNQGP